jgi:hypothetical protein
MEMTRTSPKTKGSVSDFQGFLEKYATLNCIRLLLYYVAVQGTTDGKEGKNIGNRCRVTFVREGGELWGGSLALLVDED